MILNDDDLLKKGDFVYRADGELICTINNYRYEGNPVSVLRRDHSSVGYVVRDYDYSYIDSELERIRRSLWLEY